MDCIPGFKALKPMQIPKRNGEGVMTKGEEGQPLSPMAHMFHEPGSNVYIITMFGWKTQMCPDVLKANLVHTLIKHPRFSSLQVQDKEHGGMIRWVPTKVNLDNHVKVPDIVPYLDSADKFVEDYISGLSTTTIDMSKPMWDLHLLNVKTSDAEAVGVLRVHHSLGDGMSLMSLLLACTRKATDPEALPSTAVTKKSNPADSAWLGFLLRLLWNTVVNVVMFVLTVIFFNDTKTYLKGPPGVEHNPRRFVHWSISLDDVTLVKKTMNATINDVVLGVTQAGLSTYLNRRYGENKQGEGEIVKKNNLPKNIRLRATAFMNLRPTAGINALADMMEKGGKVRWGNKIGYVLFPFTIAIQDDPLDYVRGAKAVMNQKKTSLEASFSYLISKMIFKFFGSKAVGILCHKVFSHTTMWFSNVPGPREEIALFGHPIAYIAPTCYGQPNALMIHVVSYANKITFVLSADEASIPDPHRLCDDLQDSLNLIKEAILAEG